MADDTRFYEIEPTPENYWRAIILFGRNVASYKFALAKALYDLREHSSELVRLEDLAPIFAKHIAEHLKHSDKQTTSTQSRFLNSCRAFNKGEIREDKLVEETVRLGFQNVIDAFHNVHGAEISKRFFLDERKASNAIRITDEFYRLSKKPIIHDLYDETEARWRLVETAWNLNISPHIVQVIHDEASQSLQAVSASRQRVDITSARNALNGYQKGRCFYCFRSISIRSISEDLGDVDHFFPFKLKYCAVEKPINGVANLVLSCRECNRGINGKSDRLPSLPLLERLSRRNEYLIKSYHPLRETLMLQTGFTAEKRNSFLQAVYDCAKTTLITTWTPAPCGDAIF
jgi:hypothetical protein